MGAVGVDVGDAYERVAGRGYEYGPAFRGLTAMWRRGEELFAEVRAPEGAGVELDGFGLHPMLLDAVLHPVVLAGGADGVTILFAFEGVSLHAAGAGAVRARIAPAGARAGTVSVELADAAGLPVLSVRSLTLRPVSAEQLRSAAVAAGGGGRVSCLRWCGRRRRYRAERPAPVSVLSWDAFEQSTMASDGLDVPDAVVLEVSGSSGAVLAGVYAVVHRVLEVVQWWLARPRGRVGGGDSRCGGFAR